MDNSSGLATTASPTPATSKAAITRMRVVEDHVVSLVVMFSVQQIPIEVVADL
jgi:hypothetical protein